jgi:hypothetical protein
MLERGAPDETKRSYRKTYDGASGQAGKSWELLASCHTSGAAVALTGKASEARDVLATVCGWFTEVFDTADLKVAKALLDELSWPLRLQAFAPKSVKAWLRACPDHRISSPPVGLKAADQARSLMSPLGHKRHSVSTI